MGLKESKFKNISSFMLANDMKDGSKFKNISSIILVDKYADYLLELPSIVGLKVIDAI